MEGTDCNAGVWTELARCLAPLDRRTLWRALVDKTEHPERYNGSLRRAEVIDSDASTVVRRTFPGEGEPFVEWVRHEAGNARVEYRRSGQAWRRAQAVVQTDEGLCLVYEVDDPQAASENGGVDADHAAQVLSQLIENARDQEEATVF